MDNLIPVLVAVVAVEGGNEVVVPLAARVVPVCKDIVGNMAVVDSFVT